jgi:hypothetical protein
VIGDIIQPQPSASPQTDAYLWPLCGFPGPHCGETTKCCQSSTSDPIVIRRNLSRSQSRRENQTSVARDPILPSIAVTRRAETYRTIQQIAMVFLFVLPSG